MKILKDILLGKSTSCLPFYQANILAMFVRYEVVKRLCESDGIFAGQRKYLCERCQ